MRAAEESCGGFRPFPLTVQASLVLDVFAPLSASEFRRVLGPAGRLMLVCPIERHLAELRDQIPAMLTIEPGEERRRSHALAPCFQAVSAQHVECATLLSRKGGIDLVGTTHRAHVPWLVRT